jgi:hypothetical protein
VHEEAQTHHKVKLESLKFDEAQVQPSDICRTGKWQETIDGQYCQADSKQQKAEQRRFQL